MHAAFAAVSGELAETGLDGFALFGILGGAVLLLAAGIIVVITARRTRADH